MARSRRDAGRGTRVQTIWSGTTFATNPSAVTIDSNVFVTGTGVTTTLAQLGFISGLGTANVLYHTDAAGRDTTAGIKTWAGTSLTINPGFTTITSVICAFVRNEAAAVSPPSIVEWSWLSVDATAVKAGFYAFDTALGVPGLYPSGGSMAWWAFGTA